MLCARRSDDIIFELQPRAWVYHGVTLASGIDTLRDLISQNHYMIVSLPHPRRASVMLQSVTPEAINPCSLRRHATSSKADGKAELFSLQQLEAYVRDTSGFSEFLLTRETESNARCAAGS